MKCLRAGAAAIALLLSACGWSDQASSDDVEHYTGISLCPSTQVGDMTTEQERDTASGFSYHVRLAMDRSCAHDFEEQLSRISRGDCTPALLRSSGCSVQDAYAVTGKHVSISALLIGAGRYDLRFYQ
jgi:hypothetical protein